MPASPITENLARIKKRIVSAAQKAGRDPSEIGLVAVSKTVELSRIIDAREAGCTVFGENKVQEALRKIDEFPEQGVSWHFIGHLQKNKVNSLPGKFDLIHSVDSPALAQALQKTAERHDCCFEVLAQVNISGEESKSGIPPDDLKPLLEILHGLDRVEVQGLMTIPPWNEDGHAARPFFSDLRELRDRMNQEMGMNLVHLSMGMSHDFEVAIEEGATWVRVGTALFGPRQP